ncbi:hypothetical protein A9Q84_09165 [Halobacteriovorax marinus]|uniref:Uncharacterized protein n=1 Tax=Halobacteriovorax marinus TaxID=97084 RepID=A0A1Y5F6I1_9BACT|nr:hypothetical protein A9Q84_09165 [Halobacteriovorax marinus]
MFFLDIDLRSSVIYLVPFKQDKSAPYLISVAHRHVADNLLRKLNAGLIPIPPDSKYYLLKEEVLLNKLRLINYEYIVR